MKIKLIYKVQNAVQLDKVKPSDNGKYIVYLQKKLYKILWWTLQGLLRITFVEKKNQTEEEDVLDLKQLEQALFSARELTVLIPVTWLAQHLFKTTQWQISKESRFMCQTGVFVAQNREVVREFLCCFGAECGLSCFP